MTLLPWEKLPRSTPLLIVIAAAFVVAALTVFGISSRQYLPQAKSETVSRVKDAFAVWERAGVRGRILLVMARSLPLNRMPEAELERFIAAGHRAPLVTDDNLLFAAMEAGMIRIVYHAVPDDQWQKVQENMKSVCARFDGRCYRASLFDGLQVVVARGRDLPPMTEAPLLLVDDTDAAAYDPEVFRQYRRQSAGADLAITVMDTPSPGGT